MQYRIIRKHLLSQKAIHACLDSLQRTMTKNMKYGWEPHAGLTILHDFVLQIVVNVDDAAEWIEK